MSRGIRRGICCRCLPDACSASPIKLGEMRKTKLYQSCHASRPRSCHRSHRRRGITSACAEQTKRPPARTRSRRDHLRVCGADLTVLIGWISDKGSPPRVRSRPRTVHTGTGPTGITSACAEQTPALCTGTVSRRDHLRVCGADCAARRQHQRASGSPPRVRSRRCLRLRIDAPGGITSACAEQTYWSVG